MSSTADADEVVEVVEDQLTVRKTFAAEEFPVPAIRFEVESTADEPVSFRLVEQIPESFPMDGVGFHPEYHSANWTAFQDNHVEFAGTVEPTESLVTVYGVRLGDEHDASEFLTEPVITGVSTDGDGASSEDAESDADTVDDTMIGDIISDDRNQVVKDMLTGDSESVPGLDEESDEGTDSLEDQSVELDLDLGAVDTDPVDASDDGRDEDEDDVPGIDLDFGEESIPSPDDADFSDDESGDEPEIELDLEAATDPADEAETGDEDGSGDEDGDAEDGPAIELALDDADADSETDASPTTRAITSEQSVGARLATELRDGTLTDEDLDVLRGALEVDTNVDRDSSQRAKIDHLQSRVEEVTAYTGALERFLDENGTGDDLIFEFQDELASFETELGTLSDRLEAAESSVEDVTTGLEETGVRTDDLESAIDGVDERVGDIDDDLSTLDSTVDDLEGGLETVTEDVEELDERIEDVRDDVVEIKEWREELGSMFSG